MSNALINALKNPSLFDHHCEGFNVLETHISWVILTGPFAYKIKKPMDFGFLNFTTLERRKHFCEEEFRLNQRLAPELYLEIVPIRGSEANPQLNGEGEIFEYAIKMAQFPQEGLMDRMLDGGQMNSAHVDRLADIIANFHRQIAVAPASSEFGQPAQVFAPMQQNFDQIRPMLDDKALLIQLDQLEAWAQTTFDRLQPVLAQRKAQGFIRECHGDIHLGNITYYKDDVVLFDCIEFNDEFRWIDVISDVAFLMMDLEDRKQSAFANRFFNRWLELSGDYDSVALLPFYKAYRAMVRAKISLFMMNSPGLDEESKANLLNRYRNYADLAESCLTIPNRFALVMHGYSGSGKTSISNQVVEELGAIRLRSDIERKRLAGLGEKDSSRASLNEGIYTPNATEATYHRLETLAEQLLAAGFSVVVDAANLQQTQRARFCTMIENAGVPGVLLSCQAAPETIRQWITKRSEAGQDASEATLEVFENQLKSAEPLSEEELTHTLIIKTSDEEEVSRLIARIKSRLGI